ncbi:hypothetical protein [Rhodocyclus gracilis]|uniref:DUF2335 domain-containing protein n=1 Tax=Rhodocyclus tenuis TaxID=1066 RepID=A0A6L5K0U7_RHOTE|nr:hypothetical protein [Rhodocyclus gracilis]MQY52108.1 hypothetical protein [Rhodocyclus gracilis]
MGSRQTAGRLKRGDGELTFQQQETDSPILPVPHLERLHAFRPDAVDLVLEQTKIEAEHRRAQNARINGYIFMERIVGQIFGLVIGAGGIAGGVYAAVNGQPWAGATIASAAIGGLAVAFVVGRKK